MTTALNLVKVIAAILLSSISGGLGMNGQPYCLESWEEILGPVHSVEIKDYCIAKIGGISVLLPLEFAARLIEVKGQSVAILRTEKDFRMLITPPSNADAKSSPVIII